MTAEKNRQRDEETTTTNHNPQPHNLITSVWTYSLHTRPLTHGKALQSHLLTCLWECLYPC